MWYLVLSRSLCSEQDMWPRRQPHLDWLENLHHEGRALFSGRTSDKAYGIYVLLAPDKAAAERLAAQDPYHVHGDREMTLLEWDPQRAMRMDMTIADVEKLSTGTGAPRQAG
jgi:uncharacterized protein YciI